MKIRLKTRKIKLLRRSRLIFRRKNTDDKQGMLQPNDNEKKDEKSGKREGRFLTYKELKKVTTFKERVLITLKNPSVYQEEHLKECDDRLRKRK